MASTPVIKVFTSAISLLHVYRFKSQATSHGEIMFRLVCVQESGYHGDKGIQPSLLAGGLTPALIVL